jgi:hypothetical protein
MKDNNKKIHRTRKNEEKIKTIVTLLNKLYQKENEFFIQFQKNKNE